MLYDFLENSIESEKERNFYVKFFVGYYFNELVPGVEKRIEDFCKILNKSKNSFIANDLNIELSPSNTHVTFDLHAYLINSQTDRGELADIFIVDNLNSVCVAIEAKWLEDWNYDKDIVANKDRINLLKKHFKRVYQCLLIKESKLKNGMRKRETAKSNYTRLMGLKEIPVILITWENLLENIEEQSVKNFFTQYIVRPKVAFRKELKNLTE